MNLNKGYLWYLHNTSTVLTKGRRQRANVENEKYQAIGFTGIEIKSDIHVHVVLDAQTNFIHNRFTCIARHNKTHYEYVKRSVDTNYVNYFLTSKKQNYCVNISHRIDVSTLESVPQGPK